MKSVGFVLWLLAGFSFSANAIECQKACDRPQDCRKQYYSGSKKIDFYSNYPLDQLNSCIEEVIFVVHGTERTAETRYDAVLDAAKTLGKEKKVLIISPFFKTNDDNPASNDFYWSSLGWKQGNTSNNRGTQVSSFAIADSILTTVIDGGKFPYLMRASVTGHSAGGQYTQMYALTTSSPENHPEIDFRFLVLNPSNYTYLNTYRPHPNFSGYFEQPVYWTGSSWKMKPLYRSLAGNCPTDFNDYKYGLEERNTYANRLSSSTLINQYLGRSVFYLLGELDNDEDHDSLDTSCAATLQGPERFSRGQNYFSFLNTFYLGHQHAFGSVPNVGHDARGMYSSNEVKQVLFGL